MMILTFLGVAVLFGTASILNALFTQLVVNNHPELSGLCAGGIRLLLVIGMWFAFVNDSIAACAGMVCGEGIGSYLGVRLWMHARSKKAKTQKQEETQ